MTNKTMGEIIVTRRKEMGMTQKELADQLGITDKAVSKWERDIACPDIQTIPKLAETLDISVEELLNVKALPVSGHRGAEYAIHISLKAVPVAMGIAVTVLSIMDKLTVKSGLIMLGIGLVCTGLSLLNKEKGL